MAIKLTKDGAFYTAPTIIYKERQCIIESYSLRSALLYEPIFGFRREVGLKELGLNAVDLNKH